MLNDKISEKSFMKIGLVFLIILILFSDLGTLEPFFIFLSIFCYVISLDIWRCFFYDKDINIGLYVYSAEDDLSKKFGALVFSTCMMVSSILYLLGLVDS